MEAQMKIVYAAAFCGYIYCVPAVPVETYHRMKSSSAGAIAVQPRPMEIARDSRTFFTLPRSPRRDVRSPLCFILFTYPSVSPRR